MSYIEESLSKNEEILGSYGFHGIILAPVIIFTILIVTIPIALWLYLNIKSTERGFTNKRVIVKNGIIGRSTREIKLTAIETIEISQGVLGRILNYGTIKITGRGISTIALPLIEDPVAVKRAIESVTEPLN